MKVYIGPYKNRWSVFTLERRWLEWNHKTTSWNISDDDLTKTDKFVMKACDLLQPFLDASINKCIDWKSRKTKVRIDDYDTWSMDSTLALIILPMLHQLKKEKQGYALVDDEDVPEHIRSTNAPPKENEWDADENASLRWEWVLDEIIWSFDALLKLDDDINDTHYYIDGQFNLDAYKEYNERINRGLLLFGKYYRGLWD
jgi:hypothetical protein